MGALIFVCPHRPRSLTGLDIDPDSYRALPKALAEIKCPACGLIHNLHEVDARLADESSDGTKRTNPEAIPEAPRSSTLTTTSRRAARSHTTLDWLNSWPAVPAPVINSMTDR